MAAKKGQRRGKPRYWEVRKRHEEKMPIVVACDLLGATKVVCYKLANKGVLKIVDKKPVLMVSTESVRMEWEKRKIAFE